MNYNSKICWTVNVTHFFFFLSHSHSQSTHSQFHACPHVPLPFPVSKSHISSFAASISKMKTRWIFNGTRFDWSFLRSRQLIPFRHFRPHLFCVLFCNISCYLLFEKKLHFSSLFLAPRVFSALNYEFVKATNKQHFFLLLNEEVFFWWHSFHLYWWKEESFKQLNRYNKLASISLVQWKIFTHKQRQAFWNL